jgi:hypothetical protein
MDRSLIDDAVRRGDLDELLRLVDACCEQRAWDALSDLRAACELSHGTGRQLWPAASHAAYRLALEAPAPHAAAVLVDGPGRFAPGPLAEVAGQAHSWRDLAPHVTLGAVATITAHERVVRGEDVRGDAPRGPVVLELPWSLESWEPRYPLAEYHAHHAEFPAPATPSVTAVELPRGRPRRDADDVSAALADTARAWATESNGRVDASATRGDALAAIAALGPRSARIAEVPAAVALAHVAWAGASGGAHGRRRGAAAGRFSVWWLAAALAGRLDDWPADGARLADAVASCRWFLWDAAEPATGWLLRVAIEGADDRSWAVAATDAA